MIHRNSDLTKSIQVSDRLLERFSAYNSLPVTVLVLSTRYPFELVFVSDFIDSLTGFPSDTFKTFREFHEKIHRNDRQEFMQFLENVSTIEETSYKFRILLHNGNYHWVEVIAHQDIQDTENQALIIATLVSIDRDKLAFDILKNREEIFRRASWCSNDLIYEKEINSGKLFWYANIDEALGYKQGEFPRTIEAWENSIHPNDLERVKKAINEHIKNPDQVFDQEYLIRTKDGRYKIWIDHAQLIEEEGNKGRRIIGSCSDITKSKQAYLQIQKMETVGLLAGGIAHDFNNLLTAILGFANMAQQQTDISEESRSYLNEINNAGELASSLTRELLAFSRKQVFNVKRLNLNDVVNQTQKLLQRLTGEHINIDFNLCPDLKSSEFDSSQIQQVIMNLCVNARDAMPNGGELKISTDNILFDESVRNNFPEIIAGEYVVLKISDTGTGINKEDLSRIFEPFYTTKDRGKGTGLGLSTVYGIVKQSQGYIYAESEIDKGTEFKMYLPAYGARAGTIENQPVNEQVSTGSETVLLVEDEDMVRTLATAAIRKKGYTIHLATNGEEALEVFAANQDQIKLLITDIIMPGINGMELASRIRQINPEIKIIFMSGYPDDVFNNVTENVNDFCLLEKPFVPDDLTHLIRDTLDGKFTEKVKTKK